MANNKKIKSKKKIVKDESIPGPCNSLVYTLVDNALLNHRGRDFRTMMDSVCTLYHILHGTPLKGNVERSVKRLVSLGSGSDATDINGKFTILPTYAVLSYGYYNYDMPRYEGVVTMIDNNGKIVYVYMYVLLDIYENIGKHLLHALFEILDDHTIKMPEELYTIRRHNSGFTS
jgi:hypothetical protein